ncbi:Ig-like domain-containing protein [Pacificibacter maritimus]|uniref:Ig-like domain-containing protein n=1 Tax=Pacificibacter maritimus TaxID=762213 RepID=A0A3N4U6P9_9RHOB|nr:Ig-like domain-containing protein [Pacificibacter maritimus]RPE66453.1 Ig-like domain-containing protein [Pacificibacter maritimus]
MLGIQFSLRDSAGNIEHGTLSLAESSETLSVVGMSDVSLNTSTAAISGYARSGSDLVLTLVGGKTIVLEGYFSGAEKDLLLSERGLMTHVELDAMGQGEIIASYSDIDLSGKWSEYDQIAFLDLERVEPVVAPLAPALFGLGSGAALAGAGLAGAALLGSGSGASGEAVAPDTTAPTVDVTGGVETVGDIVNGEDHDSGTVPITGTGEPGATVDVTINDVTVSTVVDDNGDWVAEFDSELIEEGEYTTGVTVTTTDDAGNSSTVTDTVVVDTEAENLTFDPVEGDDVVNIEEASDGLTITGTSEAGATVSVDLEGQVVETVVAEDGTWSVSFDAEALPAGTYDTIVRATVTDEAGNAATYLHDVHVDLEGSLTISTGSVGGDGTVNASEIASDVSISGTGEAGATVVVTVEGVSRTVTVSTDGSWSAVYEAGSLPHGTYDAAVTAISTDLAGNVIQSQGTFHIDTEAGVAIDAGHSGGDEIINFAESGAPMTFSGSADAGSTVVVTLGTSTLTTVAGADGAWTVTYPAGTLAAGEYDTTLTAVATDEYGNTATSVTSVTVDTVAGTVALSSNPIEGDNVINAVEASDGVWVTGTATPGISVDVTLGGVSHTVTATSAGTFAVLFAPSEVVPGEYDSTATATITDVAGNTMTVNTAVQIDTFVDNFAVTSTTGGDDMVMSAAETADGLTLSGTVEPNSTVRVSIGGASYSVFSENGSWSLDVPAGALPRGEGSVDVAVAATDAAGNVATLTETVTYDTLVNDLAMDVTVGGDGVFNSEEMSTSGVTLTGSVEAGSTVFVTVEGIQHQATVAADGTWTVVFAPGELAGGDYTATATVVATDLAGNTLTDTAQFQIDTLGDAPMITGYFRSVDGISSVAVQDSPDSVSVFAIDGAGQTTQVALTSELDMGPNTLLSFGDNVPNGSQIVVSSEDDAGNTSETLFVLDTGSTRPEGVYFNVDVDNIGLGDFDLGAIDLQFVNGGEVTLSASDLARLTGEDNTLTVHGGGDDRVVLTDAATEAGSTDIDGQSYDIYTLGDDSVLFVDADIDVVLP